MRKVLAIVLALSLSCGLAACGGGSGELSLISCPEQGFTTKTNPSYTWESDEVEGLYIYTEEKGSMPFVRVSWFDDIDSADDACDYMAETIRPALKESNPDGMFASTESEEKKIGGRKLPAGEYTYEEQGRKVVMQLAFDTSGDHTVVYQAKYLYEKGEETLDALDKAIRNFKAGNNPKTDKASPDLLGGAGGAGGDDSGNGGGNGGGELSLISCPEQGFTTKADPSYTWKYVEGDGITIWTMSEGSIPFLLVYQTDILRKDSYRHLCEEYTPYMREEYGDDLLDVEEYEACEIGGKKLPAALYTYKNSQGYTLQMLRLEDSTGEYTVQYTAKYQRGYGDDTLAALDTAIRNFRNTTGTSGGNTSKSPKTDSPNPGEGEFTIIPAETKTLEYETFDNGMISMEIPKGWKVIVHPEYTQPLYYTFQVVNPENPDYQIYYSGSWIGTNVANEQERQLLARYDPHNGYSIAPPIDPQNTEGLFKAWNETWDTLPGIKASTYESVYGWTASTLGEFQWGDFVPLRINNFNVIEKLDTKAQLGYICDILQASFTDGNGNLVEGIFSADVITYDLQFFHWVRACNTMFISAPADDFVNWMPVLSHCLSTLTPSDAFVEALIAQVNAQSQGAAERSAIISQTGSEISDIITDGYEKRQSTYDIISQKQSDATMGYERVYDTETGEIYKAYNGFTDDISTDDYLSERYQAVTDDMYLEGIDGYIEK